MDCPVNQENLGPMEEMERGVTLGYLDLREKRVIVVLKVNQDQFPQFLQDLRVNLVYQVPVGIQERRDRGAELDWMVHQDFQVLMVNLVILVHLVKMVSLVQWDLREIRVIQDHQ